MVVITPGAYAAQRPMETGHVPDTRRDDAVGRGLQNLGAAVQQAGQAAMTVAERLEQINEERKRFKADQALRELDARLDSDFTEKVTMMPADGAGFAKSWREHVDGTYSTFLKTLPPDLQDEFSTKLAASAAVWESGGAKAEVAQTQQWYQQGIDKVIDEAAGSVGNRPDLFQSAIDDIDDAIANSGLSPTRAEASRQLARAKLALAIGETQLVADPAGLAAKLGISAPDSRDAYFAAIKATESGGDPNAKNPRSSATGLYQFTSQLGRDWSRRTRTRGLQRTAGSMPRSRKSPFGS
jgi:hypothetical protein